MRKDRLLLALCCWMGCHAAVAANCAAFAGVRAPLTKAVAEPVGKVLAALNMRNPKALLSAAGGRLLLFRRSVSGNADRTGNVRLLLRPGDFDSNMNIRIGSQTFHEFADKSLFHSIDVGGAITLQREVCEDAQSCDYRLPPSVDVPFILNDLLRCNPGGNEIFVFTDGVFVLDMKAIAGQIPVGGALFFAKEGEGYRFAGLIIQR